MAFPLFALAAKLLPYASAVPEVIRAFGGSKHADAAERMVNVAKAITGNSDPEKAVEAVIADPALQLKLQETLSAERVRFAEIEASADADGAKATTDRAALLEGTASDLKAIPYFGPIMLFARGAQRPLIGYGTMFMDYQWFSGIWKFDDMQSRVAFLVNLLVLAFLFGERAVKNLAPLITDMLATKMGRKPV